MPSPGEEEAQTAQGWLDGIRPEDPRQVIAYAQECMVQARDFQLEDQVVHQKGEIRHILATGYFKKE
jgi:hypothetical protein